MILDFNDNWYFYKKGNEGERSLVCLPHDAMILEERGNCPNGAKTGYYRGGRYVYEKEFTVEKDWIGKRISILFEGIYRNATIYINGKNVFFHAYGYTEFEVEITDDVKEGVNRILVDVDNSLEPNSRWYSGSGIYRPVSLIIKDEDCIRNIRIRTIDINPAMINVDCDNDGAIVEIYDDKELIKRSGTGDILVENAKLWDDITPNLYRIVVKTDKDEVSLSYGIRKMEYGPEKGLLINGREVKLRGACIHHDNGILGACEFRDANFRKIRILKEHGYNAIRSAHNPCSRSILDACDKYGVYVMDESFDMWYSPKTYHDYSRVFYDNYESDIRSMIEKDCNHPSVIMYSLGNENSEPGRNEGMEMMSRQKALVKSLDDTRIVTIGANLAIMRFPVYKDEGKYKAEKTPEIENKIEELDKRGSTGFNLMMKMLPNIMTNSMKLSQYNSLVDELSKNTDVLGLNYGTIRFEKDLKRNPRLMFVGSETFVGGIKKNWDIVMRNHQVIGDFCWSGHDYLGEADGGCGTFDYLKWRGLPIADGAGAIDLISNPTPLNYYMQIEYGTYNGPHIAVSPLNYYKEKYIKGGWRMNNYLHSWSFEGCEGIPASIEVYSNKHKVSLFLNGRKIGTRLTRNNIAKFKVKYHTGELKAIEYDELGNECGLDILSSAKGETIISLRLDRDSLTACKQDLCFLNIDYTDKNGVINTMFEEDTTIEIVGDSVILQGFGSARGKVEGSYNTNRSVTHFGRCMAVLRSSGIKGESRIIVRSKGLKEREVKIRVE